MPDLNIIRAEIERMRFQVGRQRKEILQLQRAELLLARMHTKIDGLCEERDRLKKQEPPRRLGALGGRNW
jgi:hypothetical protein